MNTKLPSWFPKALLILVMVFLVTLSSQTAGAAGICYVKASASGTNNGTSWANAYTDLQSALGGSPCTEVWVAAGTYKPTGGTDRTLSFVLKNGVALYGGFIGTESARIERDPAVNLTTLSGDISTVGDATDNSYHVIVGGGTNGTAVLDGFTVTGGYANGSSPADSGGGMFNLNSSPTLANLTFSGNTAIYGGGMYNDNNSSPALINVTFNGNTVNQSPDGDGSGGGSGAGMYNNNSNPTLAAVTFSNNSAVYIGGGISNYNSSPTLTNVTFSGNSAQDGSGMYNENSGPTLTNVTFSSNSGRGMYNGNSGPTLTNVTFSNNSGGGMVNYGSSPTLTNVIFSGNTASFWGGGMLNFYSSPTLTNVTFSGNSASSYGGGMYNDNSSPVLTNVTFSGNSGHGMFNGYNSNPALTEVTFSNNSGSGMYNWSNSSPILTNVTFSGNSALLGGGMFNYESSPTLTNVTFSGNSAFFISDLGGGTGGGMYNWSNSSPTLTNVTFSGNSALYGGGMSNYYSSPVLTNVTFSGNSAFIISDLGTDYGGKGGGMYNGYNSSPQIRDSILWGDSVSVAGVEIYNDTSSPSLADSVVAGGCPSGATCANILTTDPQLVPLGNNGGFTQTIALGMGSSAIDTGNDATCASTDQRGVTRPQGAHCDMGAYEWVNYTHQIYLPLVFR